MNKREDKFVLQFPFCLQYKEGYIRNFLFKNGKYSSKYSAQSGTRSKKEVNKRITEKGRREKHLNEYDISEIIT